MCVCVWHTEAGCGGGVTHRGGKQRQRQGVGEGAHRRGGGRANRGRGTGEGPNRAEGQQLPVSPHRKDGS